MSKSQNTYNLLNKLCKWRTVFAGWQLGTRIESDPECAAVKDHREVTILLRTEANALANLLIKKRVFTAEEFEMELATQAVLLDADYEEKFPGFRSSHEGMVMNVAVAAETMKGWRP